MANPEQLAILKQGVTAWNSWLRQELAHDPHFRADLDHVDLREADLRGIDFTRVSLHWVNLTEAKLQGADLYWATLTGANLTLADLSGSNLTETVLGGANLYGANVNNANFSQTIIGLWGFTKTLFISTVITDVDLSTAKGLETVQHWGPSEISLSTLYKSGGNIPEVFLRGCGLPDTLITFAKSLVEKPIQYYSAFISYSTTDEHFVRRLHNDLQADGVRVWYAAEDLRIGDPVKPTIDEAVRLYDKLILVLSENSINRAWVRHEVMEALQKEKQHNRLVLFPIRLDDSVFDTTDQWAYDIRERYIGDFRNWANPLLYQNAINRLLRDLNADPNPAQ